MREGGHPLQRTVAAIRKSHWPGWIWAIPLGAAAVVIWLGIRAWSNSGSAIDVIFQKAQGMNQDTVVTYRGIQVGKVEDVHLSKDQSHVVAHIQIDDSASGDLKTGTIFYLENATPTLSDLSSLKSIISGPSIVMVPGGGARIDHFRGRTGNPPETLAVPVRYTVHFHGDVGALKPGDAVTLRGFNVGRIVSIRLRADSQAGTIATPVVLALDAARFHLSGQGDLKTQMNVLMQALIQKGLRARLAQSPPLIGGEQVTLEMVPDAPPPAAPPPGDYPEIPATEGGGIDAFVTKVGQLPIAQIGNNVRAITQHVETLVSSPQLSQSIAHLNRSLAEIDKVVHQAGPQVAPAIKDLRKTASEIDATAAQARRMIGGGPAAPDGNLQQSLNELTKAARAIRSLADYLDRHPEALIKGR